MTSTVTSAIAYQTWTWRGFEIGYQTQGTTGPNVVLVHGFGAAAGHWRKNLPVLSQNCRVFAIDLIGFGRSAKPTPGEQITYTFETWGQQIADFCREVVGGAAFLIGNSIGCIAVLQAAVDAPDLALGVALLNCSLRLLHDRKRHIQPWYKTVGAPILQRILKNRAIGHWFFNQVARPNTVKTILQKAYMRREAVSDELIDLLMTPAQDVGAADVFIAFTGYSQGPLAEDLLPQLRCSAIILWGDQDPWEPIALGRAYADYPQVEQFIALPGVGHCPQDEAPELVNPILQDWLARHSSPPTLAKAL